MATPSLVTAVNSLALKSMATAVTVTSSSSHPVVEPVTSAFPLSSSSPSSSSLLSNCSSSSPSSCAAVSGGLVVVNGGTSGTAIGGTAAVPTTATSSSSVVAANGKDSGWLTLEVCREHIRQRCTRSDTECRFAHPPPHVDIQNGRVVCCFDSIKGRCQRTDPPCKYLHPPQHLKEQLLQNGRNNLIMKNLQQIQRIHQHAPATVLPNGAAFYPVVNPYLVVNPSSWYPSYYNSGSIQPAIVPPTSGQNGCVSVAPVVATPTTTVPPASEPPTHEVETSNVTCSEAPYCNVQTGSQAGTQYWALSPSGGVYTANPITSPYYSHCSAVYYQTGSYSLPTTAPAAMLMPKRATSTSTVGVLDGPSKNGYTPTAAAIYPCGSAAYQQMALSAGPVDMSSCYAMAITVPPPVNGFFGC